MTKHVHKFVYIRQDFMLTDELHHGQHMRRKMDVFFCERCLEYQLVDVGPATSKDRAEPRGAQPQ